MKKLRIAFAMLSCTLLSVKQLAVAQNDRYGGVTDSESDESGGGFKLFLIIVVIAFIIKQWKNR